MDRKKKLAVISACLYILNKKKRKHRTIWVKPWLGDHERLINSFSNNLEPIFRGKEQSEYKNYVRMDMNTYDELLQKLNPFIARNDTKYRLAITPREKLSITLSYLAEGLSLRRISYEFRVGLSTASEILVDTIAAINKVLVPEYLRIPMENGNWNRIAEEFYEVWNFPLCIGFSIVLLGLVDANYKFIAVDIGANGRMADAGVWQRSEILKSIVQNKLGIPTPTALPDSSDKSSPYVILGDSGFGLQSYLMRPYAEKGITKEERIFNYRLSRARRVSENAFGILANRWRILLKRMLISPEKATDIVLACCALHNMLLSKRESANLYAPPAFVDQENTETGEIEPGQWREVELENVQRPLDRNHTYEAREVRDTFKDYFNNEGRVSWQERCMTSM